MIKREELETSTVVELKEAASELGIEKTSVPKAKLLSAIKRKLNVLVKKKEAEKAEKKTIKIVTRAKVSPKKVSLEVALPEPKLPIFENKQVLRILKDGHNATHLHCEMEGGVRMHVPRKRLEGHGEGL